ncbi:UNVERIFIED_CONTAM: hypothetical protein PYX00_004863 [Menopon gallinae]|uniref:Uncharacterized protein n=1 Tax=Menopon gallinae TaxID=328185 RepID=A0AAW2I6Z2_9NEOP
MADIVSTAVRHGSDIRSGIFAEIVLLHSVFAEQLKSERPRGNKINGQRSRTAAEADLNTPLNKETGKKQKKLKHLSPEHVEPCKSGNEVKTRTQEWTKKLVGSIRRKVNTKKLNSPSSSTAGEVPDGDDVSEAEEKAPKKKEAEEPEPPRVPNPLERNCSRKSLNEEFEFCRVRRKLSFPCVPPDAVWKTPPKKKDTTLLAMIFKKQSSVDVKCSQPGRRVPDVSVDARRLPDPEPRTCPEAEELPSGGVGAAQKTMSRSCGQVEMISGDPARENFLQATMSIFLAVSPTSRIQGTGFNFLVTRIAAYLRFVRFSEPALGPGSTEKLPLEISARDDLLR